MKTSPRQRTETAIAHASGPFAPAFEYMVDAAQRSLLFWDVMRQSGNQYREHLAETAPHVLDYEAELVVVIGTEAKDVTIDDAWSVVAGLTIGQDVSDRGLQNAGDRPQFSLGKSHDGYGPTGPYVVSPDLLPQRDDLAVRCVVNGEERQSDRTSNLIFPVAELVSYLSGVLTLQPGDLIFTGTPAGVGLATGTFLRAGDVVETEIDGLGALRTSCV